MAEDFPSGTITRYAASDWPRLVRGQRVTMYDREWRVTGASTAPDGTETYSLEPAEVVDAREARRRALREGDWTGFAPADGLEVLRTAPEQPDEPPSSLPDGAYWIEN